MAMELSEITAIEAVHAYLEKAAFLSGLALDYGIQAQALIDRVIAEEPEQAPSDTLRSMVCDANQWLMKAEYSQIIADLRLCNGGSMEPMVLTLQPADRFETMTQKLKAAKEAAS